MIGKLILSILPAAQVLCGIVFLLVLDSISSKENGNASEQTRIEPFFCYIESKNFILAQKKLELLILKFYNSISEAYAEEEQRSW